MSLSAIRPQRGVKKLPARLRTYALAQALKCPLWEICRTVIGLLGGDRGYILHSANGPRYAPGQLRY
jgi:hypothetical protein